MLILRARQHVPLLVAVRTKLLAGGTKVLTSANTRARSQLDCGLQNLVAKLSQARRRYYSQ
jgi:hypothetical protein